MHYPTMLSRNTAPATGWPVQIYGIQVTKFQARIGHVGPGFGGSIDYEVMVKGRLVREKFGHIRRRSNNFDVRGNNYTNNRKNWCAF